MKAIDSFLIQCLFGPLSDLLFAVSKRDNFFWARMVYSIGLALIGFAGTLLPNKPIVFIILNFCLCMFCLVFGVRFMQYTEVIARFELKKDSEIINHLVSLRLQMKLRIILLCFNAASIATYWFSSVHVVRSTFWFCTGSLLLTSSFYLLSSTHE